MGWATSESSFFEFVAKQPISMFLGQKIAELAYVFLVLSSVDSADVKENFGDGWELD